MRKKSVSKRAGTEFKTEWNLGLLYASEDDPKLEADVRRVEVAYDAFQKKYAGRRDWCEDEEKLFEAMTESEWLSGELPLSAPITYFNYRKSLKSDDQVAEARLNRLAERLTKNENKLLFFPLALAKISAPLQKKFLGSERLAHFRFVLELLFEEAKHNLTEPEEKIMGLKALTSRMLWIDGSEKILNKQSVLWKGKKISVGEALNKVQDLPKRGRTLLHRAVIKKLVGIADVAENELNAIVIDKKINDELRKLEKPYDRTVASYQNKPETVERLIKAVSTAFPIAHRFYKLKARMLGEKRLRYEDRSASVGKIAKKFDFSSAVETLSASLGGLSEKYREIFLQFLRRGQIDVYPKLGKQGGAFCSGNTNAPTFVLLNFSDSFDSFLTLAHEMGHAIHTELSKSQPPAYRDYSTASAEIASTFFECLAFAAVFETLTEKEKVVALHNKIGDDIQTIFRQIACFNFELELHTAIRAKGAVPKEEIAEMMNRHMASYLGPEVALRPEDGYFFVYWSHLRNFFYVYTYALGQLASKVFLARLTADKNFSGAIEKFLSAGGSARPEDILKSIGVDITAPEFFAEGLASISRDIDELERLISKK